MYGHPHTATLAAAGTGAALPFTGLNLVLMAVIAFVLITAGLALTRLVPRKTTS